MTEELLKLAERVEALQGPDREVDALIYRALAGVSNDAHWFSAHDGSFVTDERVPEVSASLDAAMTLVPEGWWLAGLNFCPVDFRSTQDREWHAEFAGPITWAVVDRELGEEPQFECEGGNAATPALALTAAALRARAQGPQNQP